jgi:uncharacterized protein (DUF433 family)
VKTAADYIGLGPCAFCGHPDAGHRIWDAIAERRRAGDSEEDIGADYGLKPIGVRVLAKRSERDHAMRGGVNEAETDGETG